MHYTLPSAGGAKTVAYKSFKVSFVRKQKSHFAGTRHFNDRVKSSSQITSIYNLALFSLDKLKAADVGQWIMFSH